MTLEGSPGGAPHGVAVPRARWYRCLGTRLNLGILLGCALVVTGIWWATLQRIDFEREQAVATAMEANANLAIAFEQQVFRTLKSAEQVAAFVREQYLRHGRNIQLGQWVDQRVIRESMFTIVSVVDEHGEIVSSSLSTGRVSYADREFFRIQRDNEQDALFVSRPVLGRVTGRWQIPMSLRITRPDGRFGGVVVMSVDPANFTDFHRHANLGRQGLLELTGLDGTVRGRTTGRQTAFGMDARDLAWFQRREVEPEGQFVDSGAGTDGVQRIVSYRTMAGYPLMVVVGTAYADELALARQRRSSYLWVAAGMTAALLLFAGLLIGGLVRQRAAARALQASEAVFRATFHQAAMGIAHIAPDGCILRTNDKFCRMLGYSGAELHSRTLLDLCDAQRQQEMRQFLLDRLSQQAPALPPEIELPYRRKDGAVLWVVQALGVVRDARGQPEFLVAVMQDVTARKALEVRLSHDALHDALTGLPNRVMFQDRFARVLESARRRRGLAGVLYIDLDGFKEVNDLHGHACGDQLLQQVAQRLARCVRSEDTVARIGGDEFGIVLAALTRAQDCEAVALKIIEALAQPFEVGASVVSISASVGAALFPIHGEDTAVLLAHADTAMYAAKSAGKNRFSWNLQPEG